MLVRRLIRSREELQYGLKLSLCVERKAEGSVEPIFQQDWRPRFQQDWLPRLVGAVRNVWQPFRISSRPYLAGTSLANFVSERGQLFALKMPNWARKQAAGVIDV